MLVDFLFTPDPPNIQNVSLTLFGTQMLMPTQHPLMSTQHPADICAGFKKLVHLTNETSEKENSILSKLLHMKWDLTTIILIVIGFSIGIASSVLKIANVYRSRQQYRKCKDSKYPRALC